MDDHGAYRHVRSWCREASSCLVWAAPCCFRSCRCAIRWMRDVWMHRPFPWSFPDLEVGYYPLEHQNGQKRADGVAEVELDIEAPAEKPCGERDDDKREGGRGQLEKLVAPAWVLQEDVSGCVHACSFVSE